ncbi:MAG: RlmE family RNA methyltransferase [Deltaproteobacteria bacterium]|nr:RlmE family RNA methyltransferase [Deltaproteobacteria bacterium]
MHYKPQDSYFKKAKQDGYRSRAAYKLLELQQHYRLMKPGDGVLDLGAAPGGWLQVAAKLVGPSGKVIGVDLQPIQPLAERNVMLINGDITDAEVQRQINELLGGAAHCVLSDLSPRLSGIRDADMARCLELNRTALAVANAMLRPGGVLLIKSFISTDLQIFTAELKQQFADVQRTKPDATRHGSSEFYFYAKGLVRRTNARQTV